MQSRLHARLFLFVALILIAGLACSLTDIPPDIVDQIDVVVNEVVDEISSIYTATPPGGTGITDPVVTDPVVIDPGTGNVPQGGGALGPAPAGMVAIPAGNFQMGCATNSLFNCADPRFSDENPLHTVYLDGYYIDIYEVTNNQYAQCVAAGVCQEPDTRETMYGDTVYYDANYGDPQYGNYPVTNMSWRNATNYCTWAGKSLPTEAQWEKAARGSSDTRMYPWGNTPADCSLLNFTPGNSDSTCEPVHNPDGYQGTRVSAVGSHPLGASPYGVMDMAGNVAEYTLDWKDTRYYSMFGPNAWPANPINSGDGLYESSTYPKVIRGAGWNSPSADVRLTIRMGSGGTDGRSYSEALGIRCASSP